MNPTNLEPIIAEVIRRLMAAAEAPDSCSAEVIQQPTSSLSSIGGTSGLPVTIAKTKQQPDAPRPGRSDSSDVLSCEERLLTLATLEGKLAGLRRLVVHRKAIVTPALKEELSRRGIELDRGGIKGVKKCDAAISVVRFDAERAPSLHGLGLAEDVVMKSLAAAAQAVTQQLANANRLVVLLTRQSAAALIALNRQSHIRAALVSNVESVRMAVKQVAANVLVVEPGHLGRVQITALLRAFENEGLRSIPSELKEVL